MKGFQIWSQNSNLVIFDSLLVKNNCQKWLYRVFSYFSTVSLARRGLNDIRFELLGQTDLESSHHLGPHLLLFSYFEYLTSQVII